jgi:hypothetical protein
MSVGAVEMTAPPSQDRCGRCRTDEKPFELPSGGNVKAMLPYDDDTLTREASAMGMGGGDDWRGITLSTWHDSIHKNRRHRICRIKNHLRLSAMSLLLPLLLTGLARGDQRALQPIVPGVGIGPARLGMTEAQARRALEAVGLEEAGCTVEIIALHHRVVALGTRFGGCAELQLPLAARVPRFIAVGGMALKEPDAIIGGSPQPLVRAFGAPVRYELAHSISVLLWSNGLVVRTAVSQDGGVITYFAVIRPGSAIIPHLLMSVMFSG